MKTLAVVLLLLIGAVWLAHREPQKQSGYLVAKEWEHGHMSNQGARYSQQASLLSFVYVHTTTRPAKPHWVPSAFRLFVANRDGVVEMNVDSTSWHRFRCGEKLTYMR